MLPLVAVIVKVEVFLAVEEVVLTFSAVEPVFVTVVGLKTPVAPLGKPLTVKLTTPANPAPGTSVTV